MRFPNQPSNHPGPISSAPAGHGEEPARGAELQRLRILHVEDNLNDAELIRALILQQWPVCEIARVDTRTDFLNALGQSKFDLILSDFSMPKFDGLTALSLAKEFAPDVPFIFFSGAIGEERAIDAVKRGATDYVLKDRPGRILSSIRQALLWVQEKQRRQQAEAELREQALLLDKAKDAIYATDLDHRVAFWNASAERLYGRSSAEVYGRKLTELGLEHDPVRFEEAHRQLTATGEWRGAFRLRAKNGEFVQVESTLSLVLASDGARRTILYIDTDVTERLRMQSKLIHADRMDSIGMLAGGVAHDLNNVLMPILMGVELLRLSPRDARDQRVLENIETSAKHGSALVRQLVAFARGGEGEHAKTDVRVLMNDIPKLLPQSMRRGIELSIQCEAAIWSIFADATQIKQTLLNLALNARDAMPGGGKLEFIVQNVTVDEKLSASHPGNHPGPHVRFTVKDTGTGIPPALMAKIFDPFFTTKSSGKGTGLGLSTVAGIVKSHHGIIMVESELGRGTKFDLYFPVARKPDAPTVRIESPFVHEGSGEVILIVDDDPVIRDTLGLLLEKSGYRVLTAAGGGAALATFAQHRSPIGVIICDMKLPDQVGAAVIGAIRRRRPEQPVIAISGDMVPESLDFLRGLDPPVEFLPKPIAAETLLITLRRLLPARGGK